MKKIIISLLASLIFYGDLQAQFSCPPYKDSSACERGNGISTDPDNLVNDNCSELKNDFEWRIKKDASVVSVNPEFYIAYDANGIPRSIRNPFNNPTNSEYRNIADNHNSNYNPKDGWELLKVDFGALSNFNTGWTQLEADRPGINPFTGGTSIPYFILYNKYTGTLRFFGSIFNYKRSFSTIKVEITIPESGEYSIPDLKATNLLSIQGEATQPLDQETGETSISIFCQYPNNASMFFWFDLPVAYDPCVCKEKSELHLTFHEMYSADIPLNGDLSRGITNSTAPAKKEFRRSLAAASSEEIPFELDQEIIPANPIINLSSITDWAVIALSSERYSGEERNALAQIFDNIFCTSDFQKVTDRTLANTDLQEYIKGEKLLDANTSYSSLISSGCFRTDNAGSLVSDFYFVEGKYTRSNPIFNEQIRLAMPGSNWSDTRLQTNVYVANGGARIPAYPTYNERLGTFALLETPVFKYEEEKINGSRYLAKLTQSANFSYSFNPIMNLNLDETKMYCRLAYSGEEVFDQKNGIHFEHNSEAKYKLTTPFVPIEHFKNMPLVAETYEQLDPKHLFIQFKIYTVSNNQASDGNPNSSYLFYTFPVKLDRKSTRVLSSSGGLIDDDFIHLQASDKIFDKPTYFAKNETLAYDGKVYISANMEVEEGKQVVIYATAGFGIAPEAELSKGLSLRRGYPFKIENQPPVSYEYLKTFCSDKQRYRAHHFAKRNSEQQQEISNERKFTIYPNPNEGVFYINFDQAITTEEELVVYSIDGKRVHTKILRPYSGKSYTVELSGLAKGLYLVKVLGNTEIKAKRVLVF
jgi:hypothetical protein